MIVTATNLQRRYDAGCIPALRGVSLDIREGEFLAIMGPSGCGKSTLLQLVGALDLPDAGEIRFRGRPYHELGDPSVFRARNVGFVFQAFHLLPTLSALDNVELPMLEMPWPQARRRQRAQALLEAVGLGHRRSQYPGKLSGGERQRVAIARSLANEPPLLLADEPTGNLDSANAVRVLELLRSLQRERGLTLVVVTHDADVAANADRVLHMRDGVVVESRARRLELVRS
jgi:putative ABC transport system ATP-binding protein